MIKGQLVFQEFYDHCKSTPDEFYALFKILLHAPQTLENSQSNKARDTRSLERTTHILVDAISKTEHLFRTTTKTPKRS